MTDRPLLPRLRDGNHLATLDMWRRRSHGVEAVIDLPTHQINQHWARTLVRHMDRIDPGRQFEHFQRQVLRRAGTGRAEADFAGILFAQLNHILDRARGLLFIADKQIGRDANQHQRREIALDVIANVRQQRRPDRMAVDVRHQQGSAVRRLFGHVVGSDHAGGTGLVFHHDRNVPHRGELLAYHPRENIGTAARRKADDDAYRPCRQGLRPQ